MHRGNRHTRGRTHEQRWNGSFRHLPPGAVGVVCGKGNNGGDGYVVARLALLAGHPTHVVAVTDRASVTGDARTFLRAFENSGGEVAFVTEPAAAAEAVAALSNVRVMVDALLGTGISGEVRGAVRATITAWPQIHTISVDLPSGMNADTGEVCGVCIRADLTVTLQFAKRGFQNPCASAWLGRVEVADIGIPAFCADDQAWAARQLTLGR